MKWFFHAVERDDGQWACQHGLNIFDSHAELEAALEHLRKEADETGQHAEFFVHYLSGDVQPA